MATTIASKLLFFFLLLPACLFSSPLFYLLPPAQWKFADPKVLSPKVQLGFISHEKKSFVPSLNLTIESVSLSQEKYLDEVKKLHRSRKENQVTEMGAIKTKSGLADLLQIEINKSWGRLLILQSILVDRGKAYILTGVVSKEDFSAICPELISSFSSFELKETPFDFVTDPAKQDELREKQVEVKNFLREYCLRKKITPEKAVESREFTKKVWEPYSKFLQNQFREMGIYFPVMMMKYTKQQLGT